MYNTGTILSHTIAFPSKNDFKRSQVIDISVFGTERHEYLVRVLFFFSFSLFFVRFGAFT